MGSVKNLTKKDVVGLKKSINEIDSLDQLFDYPNLYTSEKYPFFQAELNTDTEQLVHRVLSTNCLNGRDLDKDSDNLYLEGSPQLIVKVPLEARAEDKRGFLIDASNYFQKKVKDVVVHGIITKQDVEKCGLCWKDTKEILIANKLAQPINQRKLHISISSCRKKRRLIFKIFGDNAHKIQKILDQCVIQDKNVKLKTYQRPQANRTIHTSVAKRNSLIRDRYQTLKAQGETYKRAIVLIAEDYNISPKTVGNIICKT